MLENEFQLATQSERSAREVEEKAIERERKAYELYVEVWEKVMSAKKNERLCMLALVVL